MCLFGPGCDPGRTAGGSAEDSKVHFRRNSQIFLRHARTDRKSTRLNSSHTVISYAVFCLKKKCSKCGAENKPSSDVCRMCGVPLTAGPPGSGGSSQPAADGNSTVPAELNWTNCKTVNHTD